MKVGRDWAFSPIFIFQQNQCKGQNLYLSCFDFLNLTRCRQIKIVSYLSEFEVCLSSGSDLDGESRHISIKKPASLEVMPVLEKKLTPSLVS